MKGLMVGRCAEAYAYLGPERTFSNRYFSKEKFIR